MADFHWPAPPGDGDEAGQGRGPALRGVAQVERVLIGAGDQPPDQQGLPRVRGRHQRPVTVPGALGAVAAGPPFEDRVRDGLFGGDGAASRGGDGEVAGHDEHRRDPGFLARFPQLAAAAVHFVGGGPPQRQPRRGQPFQLPDRELRLGGELQVVRDPGLAAAGHVLGPASGHVHVEVGPGLPARGDVGGEHGGHAVLHRVRDPGVLRCHARGEVPRLQVRGLVDRDPRPDQVRPITRQPRRRQRGQPGPQVLPVPHVAAEQPLHPVPALMPGRLGDRPAVRPGARRQRDRVSERHLHAAALRHHPAQNALDLGINLRRAVRDVLYPGRRGRVCVVGFHKASNATRPPQDTRVQFPLIPVAGLPGAAGEPATQRDRGRGSASASLRRPVTNRTCVTAQRETGTVIFGRAVSGSARPRRSGQRDLYDRRSRDHATRWNR